MEWLQLLDLSETVEESKCLKAMRKWGRLTLYDHNSHISINKENETFACVFNCKRLSSQHSIVGKIKGDFKTNVIDLSCSLVDNQGLLEGKWQYQKVELARFAFRYNERSNKNIYIKVNPVNGEVRVCMNFFINRSLFEEEKKYQQIMTDYCQKLGEESEKIFNTILEIIFQREADEPFLKSGVKVNPNFPRYMKIQKLLNKIKSLIVTSSFYQIRIDTTSAHQNRSNFKKVFLRNSREYLTNKQISKMAPLYEPKYNRVYERPNKDQYNLQSKQFIKDYVELQEKNETEFAKHRNENQKFDGEACLPLFLKSQQQLQKIKAKLNNSKNPLRMTVLTNGPSAERKVLVDILEPAQAKLTYKILERIKVRHPNIVQYFFDQRCPQLRITEGHESWPLEDFLNQNEKTLGMSTKFDLMAQLCHVGQFLHKKGIGCFFRMEDIVVDEFYRVKLRNLNYAYAIEEGKAWKQANQVNIQSEKSRVSIDYIKEALHFPEINILGNSSMSGRIADFIDNQKCDIASLGLVLYRILLGKYPFCTGAVQQELRRRDDKEFDSFWMHLWTMQTEYFLTQGGPIAKLVAHLLLKCFNESQMKYRPYVEWMTVILSEIKTSLNGLY